MKKTAKAKPTSVTPKEVAVLYKWVDKERAIIRPVWTLLVKHETFRRADIEKALQSWKGHPKSRTVDNVVYHWRRFKLIAEAK